MSTRKVGSLSRARGITWRSFAARFCAIALLSVIVLLAALAATKSSPAAAPQEKQKKAPALRWDPPQVDAPVSSVSATPPCVLSDVLNLAAQRTGELIEHLQNFDAHEQIRYQETDHLGIPIMAIAEKFDYLVDFGAQSGPLSVRETRAPLAGSDDPNFNVIVDKGLPALALIFHPNLQRDYEMRCEGITQWKSQPAWVVNFRQMPGTRPRTLSMITATSSFPVSLKGRAWIAPNSGQIMHLETNLVKGIPIIELISDAISIDYAPVTFASRNIELWLPKSAVVYTDYGKRRTIFEHTFSDFQLFSVQTQQVIEKPKEPKKPEEKP
ncbi:MAG TPA: hypothetical protein VIH88_01995 [Candidatus Acidoferrales bacterium]